LADGAPAVSMLLLQKQLDLHAEAKVQWWFAELVVNLA
jgi:hypothetical protein